MPETRQSFEQLADTARLALARGDRDGARSSLTLALQSADAVGSVNAETPEALIRLGALYQDAGLGAEAERLFSDAIAVAESTLGPTHPAVAGALARLGTALIARGALDGAEPLLTRALSINERELGVDHPDHNILLNALSRLYLKQGAFQRAAPLLERLLERKRVKGEDHPEVATVLASLAIVRQSVGDHEAVEQLGRRVLQIRERTLAPNHYAIASALELLADACAARGKVREALLLYQRALSIREQTLGVSHASLRASRERIADLQLQADEESVDDDFSALLLRSVLPPSGVSAPAAPRGLPRLVLTAPVAPSSPPIASTAASELFEYAPAPTPAAPAALEAGEPAEPHAAAAERPPQAPVFPESSGLLSLHDDVLTIEQELDDAATANARWSRARESATALWDAMMARSQQGAIAATAVVALLLAVRIAQSRTSTETTPGTSAVRDDTPAPLINVSARTGGNSRAARDSVAHFAAAAAGAPTLHTTSTASSGGLGTSEVNKDAHPRRDESNGSAEASASVVLGRNVRPPVPNIILHGADSLVSAPDILQNVGNEAFSKQFWTKGSDTGIGGDLGTATNAKLIGPMPTPYYPEFLRKNGVEGEVVVRFTVDESGRPDISSFEVVRSPHDALTDAVRRTVKTMRFEPAVSGGPNPKPRTEEVQIRYVFASIPK